MVDLSVSPESVSVHWEKPLETESALIKSLVSLIHGITSQSSQFQPVLEHLVQMEKSVLRTAFVVRKQICASVSNRLKWSSEDNALNVSALIPDTDAAWENFVLATRYVSMGDANAQMEKWISTSFVWIQCQVTFSTEDFDEV